jgi:hypothetical protein
VEPKNPLEEERQKSARVVSALHRLLLIFLLSGAAATILLGIFLMTTVGRGREHLGGRLAVAGAAILLLGLIDGHANRLMNRKRPLSAPDPPGYRRFEVWSWIAFFVPAALLLGAALFF